MNTKKTIHIISGGTISHVATHLGLCAPAYGKTGQQLLNLCNHIMPELETVLHQTKMVTGAERVHGGTWYDGKLETNEDVSRLVGSIKDDLGAKIVFMPVALCDFVATEYRYENKENPDYLTKAGKVNKDTRRLKTSNGPHTLHLVPAPKIIPTIRQKRKDLFLVGFKTTDGVTEDEQYIAGLGLLKESSCNLVLANDIPHQISRV